PRGPRRPSASVRERRAGGAPVSARPVTGDRCRGVARPAGSCRMVPVSPRRLRMASPSGRPVRPAHDPADRPWLAGLDRHGVLVGSALVAVLLLLVYLGSERLRWFDAALAPYLVGTLLAVFAVAYR